MGADATFENQSAIEPHVADVTAGIDDGPGGRSAFAAHGRVEPVRKMRVDEPKVTVGTRRWKPPGPVSKGRVEPVSTEARHAGLVADAVPGAGDPVAVEADARPALTHAPLEEHESKARRRIALLGGTLKGSKIFVHAPRLRSTH